ncbi:MAG: arginine--tRNA ligase [Planctomycetota bacterium]|nr:arginine--tRNA ligase [Planctomycetota bacterium]
MSDPVSILNDRLLDALRAAFGAALPEGATPALAASKDAKFGDFQSNAAMGLAKSVGKPPREVAALIKQHADPLLSDVAEPLEIAGPGFLNVRLKATALAGALAAMDTAALGLAAPEPAARMTVVVDLCGVNLAKQMHVGHLRATVIGDALARIWERLGHDVVRQNHFGDWGLPIAMVTAAVKSGAERGTLDLSTLTLEQLERIYRRAQRESDADEAGLAAARRFGLGPKALAELEAQVSGARAHAEEAQAALRALQAQDPAYVAVWRRICDITLEACFAICRRLRANVTSEATAGESSYAGELGAVVADLEGRGVAELSEGALVVRLDELGIKEPCIIRKSAGGYLYATTDLAAIRRRVGRIGAARVMYAVDARQSLHFKQVFAAAKKAGYTARKDLPGEDAVLLHAAFGTVLGEDGRPFKTRSGENVRLSDLLDEAVVRAEAAVAVKNPDLPMDERRSIAEAVGMSAIKYADLSTDRIKDYVFSFDRMLAFEGNTGPYLLYALVRVRSIFRKAREQFGVDEASLEGAGAPAFAVAAPEEKAVALQLLRYPATLRAAAETCEPHRLCAYLYDLAGAFSSFFASCPVLQAPDEPTRGARLRLTRLTGRVLKDGLEALGLVPLERM